MSHPLTPMYRCDRPERTKRLHLHPSANPTTRLQLPTETCERILDELDSAINYPTERRVFAACCMVCWAWLPRSRYHLFKEVYVRSKEQMKEVYKLLRRIPALRTRVEKLWVHGSRDGKKDALWIGLVGYYLGTKLMALEEIVIERVDFSLIKLDSYQLWGGFNRVWRPGTMKKLNFVDCTVTHLNQLVRLAFLTKARELEISGMRSPSNQADFASPATTLPSGISLPLRKLIVYSQSPSSDLVSLPLWHTLTWQCPSLSFVCIDCSDAALDFSSPQAQECLVSIFKMFRFMQQRNDTTDVIFEQPRCGLHMRTRPHSEPNHANSTPVAQSRRKLDLHDGCQDPTALFAQILTCFEDSLLPEVNNVDGGFHRIEFYFPNDYQLRPDLCKSLDTILSRLRATTPDVHVVVEEHKQCDGGCVAPWAREQFPRFTEIVPGAFCDPEARRPCKSHPTQASGNEQGQEPG